MRVGGKKYAHLRKSFFNSRFMFTVFFKFIEFPNKNHHMKDVKGWGNVFIKSGAFLLRTGNN